MSIYPVRIKEWYVKGEPFGDQIPTLKSLIRHVLDCKVCGKKIPWKTGYVMHSATFGGSYDAWCSEECFNKCD